MYAILAPSNKFPRLQNIVFVILRDTFQNNGNVESDFLSETQIIHRTFSSARVADVLNLAVSGPNVSAVVVIRNRSLVLDYALFERVQETLDLTVPFEDQWAICAAGGKGQNGERYNALYSGLAPSLPISLQMRPITDALPDLYIAQAEHLRRVLDENEAHLDISLEPVLILEGYLKNKISLFCPTLSAGINGHYMARDIIKLENELCARFEDVLPGAEIKTLSGSIAIPSQNYPEKLADGRVLPRPNPFSKIDHEEKISQVILRYCRPLSISIIVRTQFNRAYLLRRLLTTISRSRLEKMELEIVLATDSEKKSIDKNLIALKKDFPNLNLVIAENRSTLHSRVGNLVAGIHNASSEYVMFLDDDDYLDIFAFQKIAPALFRKAQPIIITDSQVHKEKWIENETGIHILSESVNEITYSNANWVQMYSGVNALPICALVIPRIFATSRLEKAVLNYDLSEDYALFLLFLCAPDLPELFELNAIVSHISLRCVGENTVTMTDRTKWTHDISGFLHDLIRSDATSQGMWQTLSRSFKGTQYTQSALIEQQNKQLKDQAKQITLLKRQISAYRSNNEIEIQKK